MILRFTKKAEKDLLKINREDALRIKNKINQYIKTPLGVDITKLEGYPDYYRIRQGNYRIVFTVLGNEIKIMQILSIKHRREVYKDL